MMIDGLNNDEVDLDGETTSVAKCEDECICDVLGAVRMVDSHSTPLPIYAIRRFLSNFNYLVIFIFGQLLNLWLPVLLLPLPFLISHQNLHKTIHRILDVLVLVM